jgi:hypothetical protein
MQATVIGIDCATQPKKVGLALGTFDGKQATVAEVTLGSQKFSPADIAEKWVRDRPGTAVLLALDAPLGWPLPLAEALPDHRAGEPLAVAANDLFRRATDRFVKREINQQALDVGADRIARTAHAALALLGELRRRLKLDLPLAWGSPIREDSAIEVYPAATIKAHGIAARCLKDPERVEFRRCVVTALRERMELRPDLRSDTWCSDEVDAVVCLLAAQDFLLGKAIHPPDGTPVEREGWIWVRTPTQRR